MKLKREGVDSAAVTRDDEGERGRLLGTQGDGEDASGSAGTWQRRRCVLWVLTQERQK